MSAFEQTKPTSSARHLLRVALVSFIILVVALLLERWRGQYALAAWKRAMTAQGEVFDLAKLWPPPSASALAFSNQFAQALSSASLNELHSGNLAGAMENLVALSAFQRLYEQDSSLVNYMIRIAIAGLGVSVYWDALQADGWTDDQLAKLQRAPSLATHPRLGDSHAW